MLPSRVLLQIDEYRTSADVGTRSELARKIYDGYIMPDRLANESVRHNDLMHKYNSSLQGALAHSCFVNGYVLENDGMMGLFSFPLPFLPFPADTG